jgi:hypothetical protein
MFNLWGTLSIGFLDRSIAEYGSGDDDPLFSTTNYLISETSHLATSG